MTAHVLTPDAWERKDMPVANSDDLLREYSNALIHAQTSRQMSDWFEAGQAFNRFIDDLMAEGGEVPVTPIPVTF